MNNVDSLDRRILAVIAEMAATQGYAPTYREVSDEVGIAPSAVYKRVRALREGGLVHAVSGIARSLALTQPGRTALEHTAPPA